MPVNIDDRHRGFVKNWELATGSREEGEKVFADLIRCYSGPHRHFFDLKPVELSLTLFDAHQKEFLKDTRDCLMVFFAIWFQDVVYHSGPIEPELPNEEESARFFFVRAANFRDHMLRNQIAELIRQTAPSDLHAFTNPTRFFLDLVLASYIDGDLETHQARMPMVRKQRAWQTDEQFFQYILATSEYLLKRKPMMNTDLMESIYGARVRRNLEWQREWALGSLEKIKRG
jgi:predicted metal-dependent HD superfamily phosphohydrolase